MTKKRRHRAGKRAKKPTANDKGNDRASTIVGYSEVLPDGTTRVVVGYDLEIRPPLPPGALRANPKAQTLGPWIKPRYYYLDQQRTCLRCRATFTFSAREQRLWYEDFGLSLEAEPDNCLSCRREKRFESALRDEHQAAIEAANAAPLDSQVRLREAEARVRYYQQHKAGNLELAIAAARAARHHHSGDAPCWIAKLWEGWAQAQSGRYEVAHALLEEFWQHASKTQVASVAKEARALERFLKSGGQGDATSNLNKGLVQRWGAQQKEEREAGTRAKLLVAEQRRLVDSALQGRATDADMDALLGMDPPQQDAAYKEWQAATNNALLSKLETSDPARLKTWADALVVHAKQHIYLPHNLACAFALAGAPDAAYEMCRLAIQQGYPDAYQLPEDKQLGSIQARLRKLVEERPGWRSKPPLAPRYGYQVVTERDSIAGHSVPALLEELAHFLRYTTQGTVGSLAFAYYPIARQDLPESLRKRGYRFITLGEESEVCLFRFGELEPVVLLGREGSRRLLGDSLENFLVDWAEGKTGLSQLDQCTNPAASRHPQFQAWLGFLKVKRSAAQDKVDLEVLFESSGSARA